jgi:lipooligosaccharide transport system permease protein
MYLLAFGMGLGALVGKVRYHGASVSYVSFIAPALLSINIMYNAFFENTYASFVRMYYQKTFDAMMTTPLTMEEVITAEIVWGATKSSIATAIMMTVFSAFGLIAYPLGLLILPLSFLGGFAFGSIGMCFTGISPRIELFNLPIFLFITPMFLFGGTFFPMENLPLWAQFIAGTLPLTHLAAITRCLSFGFMDGRVLGGLAYLTAFSLVFFPMAIYMMRRRLIR